MRVIICDDDKAILNEVTEAISGWMDCKGIDGRIKGFSSSPKVLKELDWVDAVLLDVEMPEADGFEIAQAIRQRGYGFPIVFLTSHRERVQEAFKVKAFRYLYKPVNEEEIKECMDDILKELSNTSIIVDGVSISLKSIEYVEALGEGCALHMSEENLVSKMTLKEIEGKLGDRFFRCHKSYIVNFGKVAAFNKTGVELKSGEEIPLATRKTAEIKKAYKAYIVKYAKII